MAVNNVKNDTAVMLAPSAGTSFVLLRGGPLKPFLVTRKDLEQLFGSKRLVQRMLADSWIIVARAGKPGREALFDYESTHTAYQRILKGEQPPLLPCELRRLNKITISNNCVTPAKNGQGGVQ